MKKWFWSRFRNAPLFRRLDLRLMMMVLALVLPVSLICVAVSVTAVVLGRDLVEQNGRNGFIFSLQDLATRWDFEQEDPMRDFPAVQAEGLEMMAGSIRDFGGRLLLSRDGREAWEVLPDGKAELTGEDFGELSDSRYVTLWQKDDGSLFALAAFDYDFPLHHLPAVFWVGGGLSLLALLSCPFLYRRLKKDVLEPMATLDTGIEGLKEDLNYRIPPQTDRDSDEFLRLFDEFNAMAEEVQASRDKDVKLLETEMDNLRLQVNPHMLLNSYNMIYALAESRKYEVIQDYTLCLVDYFRYVLRRGQKMVTLRQELEFVDNFIRIQRIRFPGRFSYVYQAEEECMEALIPPLLIENFVENAIKYALDPKAPIEIMVSARKEQNRDGGEALHIAITDTGSGIRPEVLEKLRAGEPYIDGSGQKHIGIWNCLRRIELFYGEEGEARFASGEGKGTQVYLVVPFTREEPEGKEEKA